MKKFNRSVIGKTIYIILLNICLAAFLVSVAGLFAADGLNVYGVTEKDNYLEIIRDDVMGNSCEIIISELVHDKNPGISSLYYRIISDRNEVVAQSDRKVVNTDFVFYYDVDKVEFSDLPPVINGVVDPEHVRHKLYRVEIELGDDYIASAYANFCKEILHLEYTFINYFLPVLIVSVIAGILILVVLICSVGRRSDSEEPVAGIFSSVPYEIIVVAALLVVGVAVSMWSESGNWSLMMRILMLVFSVFIIFNVLLGLFLATVSRIKNRNLIKSTISYKLIHFLLSVMKKAGRFFSSFISNLSHIKKTAFIVATVFVLQSFIGLMAAGAGSGETVFLLYFLFNAALAVFILSIGIMQNRIKIAGEDIAAGNIDKKIPTDRLWGDYKKHAENLNSISEGMRLAVSRGIKSERMKTELITNVSHDLKTPLTSIVNYADLIAKEPCENKNITEYSEILVKQSGRLKRLIEDLVEASKASSGNLEVEFENCNPGLFLSQVNGEYEEKLKAAQLTLITKQPEEEIEILADPRRMWRIFDNLMNNICKYSLPGSRVYLSLEVVDKNAVIVFKNTSKEPLDISEEELMERFVRGDSSRNTEGNGLGLSIAKSLAELQKGSLSISIDGDLFKAILAFPVADGPVFDIK